MRRSLRFTRPHLAGALVVSVLLTACATPATLYGPAERAKGYGYSDFAIETDRRRVSFQGGPDLSAVQVEGYALRRAAEVTLDAGADWFRVVDRSRQVAADRAGGTSVGVGAAGGSSGRSSVGLGVSIDLTPPRVEHAVSLEILLGRGAKPPTSDVYDARSVIGSAL